MSFQKFKEYLNDKADLQKKPIIDPEADTGPSGKSAPKPPKAVVKGKNWKNFEAAQQDPDADVGPPPNKAIKPPKAATKGKNWKIPEAAQIEDGGDGRQPAPYMSPGSDPGQLTADGNAGNADPLGQKGDKGMIYNPKTMDQALKMKKLHDTTPENTKTEIFLNKTKGLSTSNYAEYVLKQSNPKGIKQIIETVEIINHNELLVEALVRELKRKGDFTPLISAILSQSETYAEIAARLANESHGKDISRQLAKAINEITADTASNDDIIREKPASKSMPINADSINPRGKPVVPEENSRHAKTVKGVQVDDDSIMQSKKQYVMMRPEHHLIEALANYKAIRSTMKKIID